MSLNIQRTFALSEAYAAMQALDLFSRLGIGQIDQIAEHIRMDDIPAMDNGVYQSSTPKQCEVADGIIQHVERLFDYPYGASYGIGHEYVTDAAHNAFELKKVIDKTLSEHRDPNPRFRGVNYDGVIVKYTKETTPEAQVLDTNSDPVVQVRMTAKHLAALNEAIDLKASLCAGDFQAISKLVDSEYLIPFYKKDYFGKPKYEGRPKASEEQKTSFNDLMGALGVIMGYQQPLDSLKRDDLPKHVSSLLSAQKVVKNSAKNEPETMKP